MASGTAEIICKIKTFERVIQTLKNVRYKLILRIIQYHLGHYIKMNTTIYNKMIYQGQCVKYENINTIIMNMIVS